MAGSASLGRCTDALQEAGLVDLIDGDFSVSSAISLWLTPGHTPGHQCVLLSSAGEKAVVAGDVTHTAMQLNHPDWLSSADMDPITASRSRGALFDRIDAEGLQLCAGHFPYPSIGRVIRVGARREWQPISV